ncbi:alpha/beta fold hydrolase [Streptomyces sp. NA04227]|uniref:alpha/beta hydrolase n=1 Tax=Streptomyces sp. NA04227 TaxID=2742136 RepID=UPI001591DA92|nr:alpha/beta hydrolase [Streptomyces sp. NA04227]QKW09010.1 alpha/beta fold hydrolase [Streptomyces sp. NA04227]
MPMPPRAPRAAALVSFVVLAASLPGCGDDKGEGHEDLSRQRLSWSDCPVPDEAQGAGRAPTAAAGGGRWQCTTMKAPRDWDEPRGETIDLALVRATTTGTEKGRIGSLIFNFGGPGGSGVSALPSFGDQYAKLRTRYDLVSFDPRGVGASAPVICQNGRQLDAHFQQDATPDNAAERTALLDNTRDFNSSCAKNSGAMLPHVRTTDAARDLDLMRRVLGDAKLYYFGISYGTELGGVYAHLFPRRVGRAVLDAVVDPSRSSEQGALGQARGFQLALDNFAEDCAGRREECPLGDSAAEVESRMVALLKRLDRRPLPGALPRRLTQTAALNGIAQSLYSKDFWDYLIQGLQEAYDGRGQTLMLLSDAMNGRNPNGSYSNIQAANMAINCSDEKARYSVADVRHRLPAFRRAAPLFGEYLAWGMLGCTDWPVPGAADHPEVSAPGAPPILVVGNTGDPATPYEGTHRMARALGKGVGVELTYRGQGHGSYDSGDACVRATVDEYLLAGRVPRSGKVCG